jgi:hypothetical protein
MAFFENIKQFLYFKKLRFDAKALNAKPRDMMNIDKANRIGILFDASSADNIITVTKYAESLSQLGKKVSILAYQNNKDKENSDPKFFNKLNINWFYIPESDKIIAFQQKNFDILICAFVEECLPLEYIVATSDAKCRVGAFSDAKTSYYELMINTKKNQSLKYLLVQINHFLKVINP